MPEIYAEKLRFSTEDYRHMLEAGVLEEGSRLELIDGEILPMTAMAARHFHCTERLSRLFIRSVGEDVRVAVQSDVEIGPYYQPVPDLALFRPVESRRLPRAGDVLLLIEVADTSYEKDRDVKLPRYAEAGVPEVWIVNLRADRIEAYSDPQGSLYRSVRLYAEEDEARLPHTDRTASVREILG